MPNGNSSNIDVQSLFASKNFLAMIVPQVHNVRDVSCLLFIFYNTLKIKQNSQRTHIAHLFVWKESEPLVRIA